MAFWSSLGRAATVRGQHGRGWRASLNRTIIAQGAGSILVGVVLGTALLRAMTLSMEAAALVLVAVVGLTAALVVGQVRRLLLGILLLDVPLQIDVNLAYQADPSALGALGGLSVSVTTVCLLGLYVLWLVQALAHTGPRAPRTPFFPLLFPLVLYVASVLLSVTVARDTQLATFEAALLVQTFLVYVYILGTVRTRSDIMFIMVMLLTGLGVESLIMMFVYFTRQHIDLPGLSTRVDAGFEVASRVAGTLGSPNSAATYLSVLLAPTLSMALLPVSARVRALAMFAAGLNMIALVLTFTRGGWIAAGVSLLIFGFVAWRRRWISPVGPALIVVILLGLLVLFREPILGRVVEGDQGSARSRLPLMQLAWEMIRDHPWLGVGPNNFATMINRYSTPEFGGAWLFVVHNKYLLVWAETGLIGLSTFLLFLAVTLNRGRQGWQRHGRHLSPLALGLTAAVAGNMVHMLFDLFSGRAQVQLLWLVASLIAAIYRIEDDGTWG